jgi:hypothetical protein
MPGTASMMPPSSIGSIAFRARVFALRFGMGGRSSSQPAGCFIDAEGGPATLRLALRQ